MRYLFEIKKWMEHYEIYLNGKFKCSCDTNEIATEIKTICEEENVKYLQMDVKMV